MLELIPFVVGLFTDNQEVVKVAAESPIMVGGGLSLFIYEILSRLIPSRKQRDIITGLIAFMEFSLPGLKALNKKLSVKKK